MMLGTADPKEMRMVYLSASVLGLSIIAIIFLIFGYTLIFYVVAVLAIVVGYYFARGISDQKNPDQAPKKRQR